MKDATDQKWTTAELASVSTVFTDGNWIETKDQASKGIRLVQTGNVGEGVFKDRRDKARWIDDQTFARLNCFEVLPGDCLVSRLPDPVGRACIIPETGDKMITAVDCTVIRPDDAKIDPRFFVYYSLTSEYLRNVDDRCTGTTRRRISRKNLGKIPIPLPPLEEQQRIVAVLDEAFEGLARARAHAEANLQNAGQLFDGWAIKVFGPSTEGADQSEIRTIGDVCQIQSGAGFPKKFQGVTAADYPFYKVSDMNLPGNEWELCNAVNYVSEDVRKKLGAKVFPEGAIVFPKVGGAILTNKKRIVAEAGCVDNNVMGLIPSGDKVVTKYLHEWLRSVSIYEFSNKANPPSITQGTVRDWPLKVPPIEQQELIATIARKLRKQVEQLTIAYSNRLSGIDGLRQSLLQKAFAGELT